jgi:hypothetical protein
MTPTITLYSTYYGLTQNIPSWDDTAPYEPLRGVTAPERAYVAHTGLVRISDRQSGIAMVTDDDLQYQRAPFEVFKGEGFEIISRRYA